MENSEEYSNLSDVAKVALIQRQAAEIETLKFKLSKYETLNTNQEIDEVAAIQARLSGTRYRVIYSNDKILTLFQNLVIFAFLD